MNRKDSKIKILIAEDSADDAELITRRLIQEGFQIEWRRVQKENDFLSNLDWEPDLIICDYSMPSFTGLRALELRNAIDNTIPLILVSGTIGEEVAVQALKKGAEDYLLKDRLERLGSAVEHALEQRQLRHELQTADLLLRKSEERYRTLAESAQDAIFLINHEHRIEYVNPQGASWFGMKQHEMTGLSLSDVFPPATDQRQQKSLDRVFESGKPYHSPNLPFGPASGRWLNTVLTPIKDESGKVQSILGVARDVTVEVEAEEQLKRRLKEQEALFETTRDIAVQSDINALLKVISERAARLLNAAHGSVLLYRPANRDLVIVAGTQAQVIGEQIKLAEGLSGRVAQSRKPMIVQDYEKWKDRAGNNKYDGISAMIGVPMQYQGELVGVLTANDVRDKNNHSDGFRQFTETDSNLLELFAGAAAGAVYSARLLEDTRNRAEEFKNLYEITKEVTTSSQNLDALLENIVVRAAELLHAGGGGIYLYDPTSKILNLSYTLNLETVTGMRLELGEGMAGRVAETREPLIIDDYSSWEGRSEKFKDVHVRASLEVPMLYGQELIGVLVLNETGESTRKYSQEDARFLSLIASAVAGAVYSTRLFEQTRQYAQQMESINRLGRILAESLDLQVIYDRLARTALELLPDSATVFISVFDQDESVIHAVYGMQDGELVDVADLPPLPLETPERGTQSKVIHSGEPLIIDDLQSTLQRNRSKVSLVGDEGPLIQSAVYVPMLAEGLVIGVLQMQSYSKSRYSHSDADVLSLVANTAAVAIQNANLFSKLQLTVDQLSGLHSIDTAIASTTDLRMSLRTVLDNVTQLLKVDAAAVLLVNQANLTMEHAASRGFRANEITKSLVHFGEGTAGQAALERKVIHLDNPVELERDISRKALMDAEGFEAYVAAPLVAKGQVRGVLEVFNRSPLTATADWLDFLKVLSSQASLAVDSGQMFEGLGRANLELTLAYDATIEGWSQALDLRDKETEGHTQRVTELTLQLARLLDINSAMMVHIRRGALLHDIGKMAIPDRILLKPDKLTDEEWVIMRRHPVYAHDLLANIAYLRPALDIPANHHEKWDGSGYPNGLKGEQIPLAARIFAVVDVYDALTSDRPYRPAWTKEKAFQYIQEESGKYFDPRVADIFLRMIKSGGTRSNA